MNQQRVKSSFASLPQTESPSVLVSGDLILASFQYRTFHCIPLFSRRSPSALKRSFLRGWEGCRGRGKEKRATVWCNRVLPAQFRNSAKMCCMRDAGAHEKKSRWSSKQMNQATNHKGRPKKKKNLLSWLTLPTPPSIYSRSDLEENSILEYTIWHLGWPWARSK